MTPMEKLFRNLETIDIDVPNGVKEVFLTMEEECIKKAIMYSLDEDGHTGDWKIKFADNYIKKLKDGEVI